MRKSPRTDECRNRCGFSVRNPSVGAGSSTLPPRPGGTLGAGGGVATVAEPDPESEPAAAADPEPDPDDDVPLPHEAASTIRDAEMSSRMP